MKRPLLTALAATLTFAPMTYADKPPVNPERESIEGAARAINGFGLDLHRALSKQEPGANLVFSPYSLEAALALALRGADGETRDEMAKVLRVPATETDFLEGLAKLDGELAKVAARSAKLVKQSEKYGGPSTPVKLSTANQLFGQKGYGFRKDYLAFASGRGTPFEAMDFMGQTEPSRRAINQWVSEKTNQLIPDLIPAGGLTSRTRLVIANALYFKAAWVEPFGEAQEGDFHKADGSTVKARMMSDESYLPAAKRDGYSVFSLPYVGREMSFLVLVPDQVDGLPTLEAKITPGLLAEAASLPGVKTEIKMPKFSLRPPVLSLSQTLAGLGMKTAFDLPPGSANFGRLAERRPSDYLAISEVFHQARLDLDEKGTEAAAATAVVMVAAGAAISKPKEPLVINVDRPFLFALQHTATGTCLFLGRVTDPR